MPVPENMLHGTATFNQTSVRMEEYQDLVSPNFEIAIRKLSFHLWRIFEECYNKKDESFEDFIQSQVGTLEITEQIINIQPSKLIFTSKSENTIKNEFIEASAITDHSFMSKSWGDETTRDFVYAYIFMILANQSHGKGEIDKAWSLLTRAYDLKGHLEGYAKVSLVKKAKEEKAKIDKSKADASANTKNINSDIVFAEAKRLLPVMAPSNGWSSKAYAVNDIEESVIKFIEENKLPFSKASINKYLRDNLDTNEVKAYRNPENPPRQNKKDRTIPRHLR